ncbi:RNA polymerase sigma factor [Chromatocurvus halotolerans]|uniref:RNA polymerase sigma-70 factor (ECF subfamily) n=1 Tax=Chromatocurvus halotolerans TaxID=1132028 RepID=A0A4R2KX42_9GAMM|nr:sigma-70 family RNA polymerase sigma factor [Chromatocurvus halotolerans]TCO75879.1 RNA polymerase sigma-70 factor (ECF subfamily) [Chromatocurvus halotolerans]
MRTDQSIALDHYLVSVARMGDRNALEHLAQRWQPKLLAHARRLMGEEEPAREATQDAWLEILRGLPGLREARAFPAWAYRIVSRRCARSIRQRQSRRQRDVAETFDAVASENASPEQSASTDELHAVLAGLSAHHRATLALFYLEGLTVTETAAALDIAPGTVKTRLLHARNRLRARLKGDAP